MTSRDYALSLGGCLRYREFTIPYTDLTAAATTQNVTLMTLPKFGKVLGVTIKHSTAFAGTGPWTSCTVSVGSSGDPTAHAGAFDIFQAVGDTVFQDSDQYKSLSNAAYSIIAKFTASHNVSTATAGQVDIRILYMDVTTPA